MTGTRLEEGFSCNDVTGDHVLDAGCPGNRQHADIVKASGELDVE